MFKLRNLRSEAMGFKYLFSVIPNKECVYAKKLPEGISLSDCRPVFNVLSAAEGHVRTCYPIKILQEKAMVEDVYIRGDTHWNHRGAFYAYREMMTSAGIQAIDEQEIEFTEVEVDGDLTSKLGERTKTLRGKIRDQTFKCLENNNVPNIGHRVVYENSKETLPSCVLFRDSFSTQLLDVYAQTFRRLVCLWQPNLDYSIIEEEKPDFVLSQQAERFLVSCPNDLTGKSNAEYVAEKKAAALRKE